jgi:parvin
MNKKYERKLKKPKKRGLFLNFFFKIENVKLLFELMDDICLRDIKCRPEDVVNCDLKSTMRIVYNLFNKYKDRD